MAALTLAVFRLRGKQPVLKVGWLWYLGTLFPVIGLTQSGMQAMADRFTYLPLIGLFMAVTWGLSDALGRGRRSGSALLVTGACVVVAFAAAARGQVGLWKDNVALFRHALEVDEKNYLAHNMLGCALLETGRAEEAIPHFRESLRVNPGYSDAVMNLGVAYLQTGRPDQAVVQFRSVLKAFPRS